MKPRIIKNTLFGDPIDVTPEEFKNYVEKFTKPFGFPTDDSVAVVDMWEHDNEGLLKNLEELMFFYKSFLITGLIAFDEVDSLLTRITRAGINYFFNQGDKSRKDIGEELAATLIKKNADYGNSSIKNGGLVGNYVRMTDKLSRIQNLTNSKVDAQYEKLSDTWLDIAGYSVLGRIILDKTFEYRGEAEQKDQDSEQKPFGFDPEKDI